MNEASHLISRQIIVLGYGGLLPFYGCVFLAYQSDDPVFWTTGLHVYAGLIASFLGAVYWGLASSEKFTILQRKWMTVWGVTPAVLGWFCILLPHSFRVGPLLALFVLMLAVDRLFLLRENFWEFWLSLRIRLTFGVIVALTLSTWAV